MGNSGDLQSSAQEKITLGRLNPMLRLYPAPNRIDGAPSWVLYDPLSNTYYKLGWVEFECVARMFENQSVSALVNSVNAETSLNIDAQDVQSVVAFLAHKNLLEGGIEKDAKFAQITALKFWIGFLHKYFFFSVPLLKPQKFLQMVFPVFKVFMHPAFLAASGFLFYILLFLTAQRADEFSHTFFNFLSFDGMVMLALTIFFVKILHEFGHAFTAYSKGVEVPHMGLAFIVFYPVLYTETSGVWRLKEMPSRVRIGLAGIVTELVLATYALLIWNLSAPGMVQSMAFAVVAVALIGSLLVNVNPLMRFDGYFVLSDVIGLENLHQQGFLFAKWWLRKTFFGLQDPPPDGHGAKLRRFLIVFGFMTLVYRFFLYLGIAFLIYWITFKPLGLFLMVVELGWFIGLPIWNELKVWWARRADILGNMRTNIFALSFFVAFLLLFFPVKSSVQGPAVLYSAQQKTFYAPVASYIAQWSLQDGQDVEGGDVLAVLRSPDLEMQVEKAQIELRSLETQRRVSLAGGVKNSDQLHLEIDAKKSILSDLMEKKDTLVMRAPFSGTLRLEDLNVRLGLRVAENQRLFHLVDEHQPSVMAYIDEASISRIMSGQKAEYKSASGIFYTQPLRVSRSELVGAQVLAWKELSSIYGGMIPSEMKQNDNSGRDAGGIVPRQAMYAVSFDLDRVRAEAESVKVDMVEVGQVRVHVEPFVPIKAFWSLLVDLAKKEL